MTRAELYAFFPPPGALPALGANSYAVPTLAWLQGPCYDAFRARYFADDVVKWTSRWQCRDFARAFALFATECWALTPGTDPSEALAVGEVWFLPDPSSWASAHAICPAITDRGLVFVDPQNNQLWPITSAQLSSRYFLRF